MKLRGLKALWPPQLPSLAKLILQLCLQADALGLCAPGKVRAVRLAVDLGLSGLACVLATALLLEFNRDVGEYFPL